MYHINNILLSFILFKTFTFKWNNRIIFYIYYSGNILRFQRTGIFFMLMKIMTLSLLIQNVNFMKYGRYCRILYENINKIYQIHQVYQADMQK